MPRAGRDGASGPGSLPGDLRRLVEPRVSGCDYTFISVNAGTVALLLRHPLPFAVIESMRSSGRISDELAETLANAIKQARSGAEP